MPSPSVVSPATLVQHPDNLLDSGSLPPQLEGKLRADGIRFATKLQATNGHTFLLCGHRCPCEAGTDMLRDAVQIRQSAYPTFHNHHNSETEI